MTINRRSFLKSVAATLSLPAVLSADDAEKGNPHIGCLVDTTLCIGCRRCEESCNRGNKLDKPEKPFSDRSVFNSPRRPDANAFTVVNRYDGYPSPDQKKIDKSHCKVQCMHCLKPGCVSACVVGAMTKAADGSVVYNKKICLGCRYCMVACPFEIPAYEYQDPITPRVRKCEFCFGADGQNGANPRCAASCPTEALVFGKRDELLTLARHRIKKRPDRYIDHIYGEKEGGGTSWLYLTGRPHQQLGLLPMVTESPAMLTEAIQHGIFKFGIIPLATYGVLATVMWRNRRTQGVETNEASPISEDPLGGDETGGNIGEDGGAQ